MITAKDIRLATFVWYVLPGINLVFFLVVLPLAILDYGALSDTFSFGAVAGLTVVGMIGGFLMDSMKLYQFTPGYHRTRKRFYDCLARVVHDTEDASTESGRDVFRSLQVILSSKRSEERLYPDLEHARWVMINHTSKVFYISAFLWACLLFVGGFSDSTMLGRYALSPAANATVRAALCAVSALIAVRLDQVFRKVLRESNRTYVKLAANEKKNVLASLRPA